MTIQEDLQKTGESQTITTVLPNSLPSQATFNEQFDTVGGNILGRWNHTLANGSQASLQVYDDYSRRTNIGIFVEQNTVGADLQHHVVVGSRQDVVWGLGARVSRLLLGPGYSTTFSILDRTDTLFSAFVQDEIKVAKSLTLTVGSKFERNDYTGFEIEPSVELVWTPTNKQSVWLSAARAIRQPSALDTTLHSDAAVFPAPGVPFALLTISGNPAPTAETLKGFQAGYRAQLGARLSVDLAAFTSYYGKLRSYNPGSPFLATDPPPLHLELPFVLASKTHASTYGGEIFLNWSVTPRWRISPGYSRLQMDIIRDPLSIDVQPELIPGSVPMQQFQIRSSVILTRKLEWTSGVFYTGRLRSGQIPAYTRVDSLLAWRLGETVELSIAGQNLLTPRHAEFPDELGTSHTLVERTVFAKVSWRF